MLKNNAEVIDKKKSNTVFANHKDNEFRTNYEVRQRNIKNQRSIENESVLTTVKSDKQDFYSMSVSDQMMPKFVEYKGFQKSRYSVDNESIQHKQIFESPCRISQKCSIQNQADSSVFNKEEKHVTLSIKHLPTKNKCFVLEGNKIKKSMQAIKEENKKKYIANNNSKSNNENEEISQIKSIETKHNESCKNITDRESTVDVINDSKYSGINDESLVFEGSIQDIIKVELLSKYNPNVKS